MGVWKAGGGDYSMTRIKEHEVKSCNLARECSLKGKMGRGRPTVWKRMKIYSVREVAPSGGECEIALWQGGE